MSNIKLLRIFILINLSLFISIFFISIIYLNNRVIIYSQTKSTRTIPIFKEQPYSQSVEISGHNAYLTYINLFNLNGKHLDDLAFKVISENKEVAMIPFSGPFAGEGVGVNEWVKFQFPPLSARQVLIMITADTKDQKDAVFIGVNDNKAAMKIYSKEKLYDTAISQMQNFYARIIKDKFFFICYLIIIFGVGLVYIHKSYEN